MCGYPSAKAGADDIVVGFEHEADARRFLDEMRERLAAFALTLHGEKTRLRRSTSSGSRISVDAAGPVASN
jgi:hypothetical protein